jgi:hypothetical protein
MDVSEREQYLAAIHGDRDAFEMITMHNGDGPFSGRCVAARGRADSHPGSNPWNHSCPVYKRVIFYLLGGADEI